MIKLKTDKNSALQGGITISSVICTFGPKSCSGKGKNGDCTRNIIQEAYL